jgi:hypothetical protein
MYKGKYPIKGILANDRPAGLVVRAQFCVAEGPGLNPTQDKNFHLCYVIHLLLMCYAASTVGSSDFWLFLDFDYTSYRFEKLNKI